MITYSNSERLEYGEYREFLVHCRLGEQYPRQRFEERVTKVLANVDICITARDENGLLVGICFGLTDWAYFLFLTDLGVRNGFERQGIGRKLVERCVEEAGGPGDITVTTIANENALEFYEALGINNESDLVVRYCNDYEEFVVS